MQRAVLERTSHSKVPMAATTAAPRRADSSSSAVVARLDAQVLLVALLFLRAYGVHGSSRPSSLLSTALFPRRLTSPLNAHGIIFCF